MSTRRHNPRLIVQCPARTRAIPPSATRTAHRAGVARPVPARLSRIASASPAEVPDDSNRVTAERVPRRRLTSPSRCRPRKPDTGSRPSRRRVVPPGLEVEVPYGLEVLSRSPSDRTHRLERDSRSPVGRHTGAGIRSPISPKSKRSGLEPRRPGSRPRVGSLLPSCGARMPASRSPTRRS